MKFQNPSLNFEQMDVVIIIIIGLLECIIARLATGKISIF